ncbi:hypothetical protein [Lentzea sp. E54]|uniref:hypothetical protein n=1 Tax=Lentzea xerophila TaxID=3435883 RepID=UPI003DA2248A
MLDHAGLPEGIEDALSLAMTRISLLDRAAAVRIISARVGIELGRVPMDKQDCWTAGPVLVGFSLNHSAEIIHQLERGLRELNEDNLISFLYAKDKPAPGDEPVFAVVDETEDPREQVEYEVADAYATLAAHHARRGDFVEAESLAYRAAEAGSSEGLEELSGELAERGDRAEADRLALCAVNMTSSWQGNVSSESAWAALARTREDAVLELGLDAEGNTAQPW